MVLTTETNSNEILRFYLSWMRDLATVKVTPIILFNFSHVILSFWQLTPNNSNLVILITSLFGRSHHCWQNPIVSYKLIQTRQERFWEDQSVSSLWAMEPKSPTGRTATHFLSPLLSFPLLTRSQSFLSHTAVGVCVHWEYQQGSWCSRAGAAQCIWQVETVQQQQL